MHHRRHTAARPDGNITICSDMGTVERDTVQCVHCGKQWTIQQFSGRIRNFCPYHKGPLCGAPACDVCYRMDHGMQHGMPEDPTKLKAYLANQKKEMSKALHEATTKGGIILP